MTREALRNGFFSQRPTLISRNTVDDNGPVAVERDPSLEAAQKLRVLTLLKGPYP
jgi:hypothetical protein